jgi:hypothetical protein
MDSSIIRIRKKLEKDKTSICKRIVLFEKKIKNVSKIKQLTFISIPLWVSMDFSEGISFQKER